MWDERDLRSMPHRDDIALRFDAFLARSGASPVIHELADALIGDNYPYPDRMLVHGI